MLSRGISGASLTGHARRCAPPSSGAPFLGLIFLNWLSNPPLNGARSQDVDVRPSLDDPAQPGTRLDEQIETLERTHPEIHGWIPQIYGRFDQQPPVLFELYCVVEQLLAMTPPAEAFEAVLEFFALREGPRGGEFFSPASVRTLLTQLAETERVRS